MRNTTVKNKAARAVCLLAALLPLVLFAACASAGKSAGEPDETQYINQILKGDDGAYERALVREPDNPDIYYARGNYLYYTKYDRMAAAGEYEKALEKDPEYRVNKSIQDLQLSAAVAAGRGLTGLKNALSLNDMSLNLQLGFVYYDAAANNQTPASAVNDTYDMALAAFRKGWELDIVEGRHNTPDAKVLYYLYRGDTLAQKGDWAGAEAVFTELIDDRDIIYDKTGIAERIRITNEYKALAATGMYYVSAAGSDDNDGLSQAAAFKTLFNAVLKILTSDIKAVTVIGRLNDASEGGAYENSVFLLVNVTSDPFLITGIPYAAGARRAVLSGAGAKKNDVIASGRFRFEHIELSGSPKTGLTILRSEVTLGTGALVTGNKDCGVILAPPEKEDEESAEQGHFILDGGIIANNTTGGHGAGVVVQGAFTMKQGFVRNNTASGAKSVGGGILIASLYPVSIQGGEISGNRANVGGGMFINHGSVTMSGGAITGNTATGAVGGVAVGEGASLTQQGGSVTGNTAPSNTRSHDIYRIP
jgi:hypothetical protein